MSQVKEGGRERERAKVSLFQGCPYFKDVPISGVS